MKPLSRTFTSTGALLLVLTGVGAAQQPSIVTDMLRHVGQVERKMVSLAKLMPEAVFAWKPTGARTTAEVLQHVAAENYFLPASIGTAVPAKTKINAGDYATVQAYESRKAPRDEVIAELEASFAHLRQALGTLTAAQLTETIKFFGSDATKQQFLTSTVTHLHEHLGQLIAYARSNNIAPPWS